MSGLAVAVFGVNGVGKSTLLAGHVASHPDDVHVVGSSVVKAVIAPASVRDLDEWPEDRRDAVRREAIERLCHIRDAAEGALLVCGHYSLRNRVDGELTDIRTEGDLGFYDAYVLLDATSDQVFAQVSADSRPRPWQTRGAISEHLEYERRLAHETVATTGRPLCVIAAPDHGRRLDEMATFLRRLKEAAP